MIPPNNHIERIKLVYPGTEIYPNKYSTKKIITKTKAKLEISIPNFTVSFSGLSENANIPSSPRLINFRNE